MVAILVILTITAFVVTDALIQRAKARKAQAQQPAAAPPSQAAAPRFVFANLQVPQGVFLSSGHTWLSLNSDGKAQIGMDDFAQRVIGRIDAVEMPEVGKKVLRGEPLFVVRQGSRRAVFSSPVEGVVGSVNVPIAGRPEALKSDPYQKGWICALNPMQLAKDLRQLTIAEETKEWLSQEVQRFLSFVVGRPSQQMALGHVLQDGGEPADGLLEMMDEETWGQFTQKFLKERKMS
jgi:glycine cleavage system H protein